MDGFTATVTAPPEGTEATVTVSGRMTIEHAAPIKAHLLQSLESAQQVVVLDLEGVEAIDLTGLQFICALHRGAFAQGKRLRLRGEHGGVIAESREAAGFQAQMKCCSDLGTRCVWCQEAEDAGQGGI